uniref:Uncharacterized protein n=1 Tax=Tetranychus urticae TaxID=32264 RepID=T1KWT2_TETUR
MVCHKCILITILIEFDGNFIINRITIKQTLFTGAIRSNLGLSTEYAGIHLVGNKNRYLSSNACQSD